eukprot:CAMPEP_0194104016 /NCGR_PEP_ID=MMETSP0150-20130528/4354_1 /TAXON_ID=122233 /ORGANISM="Chaetoceros debilis, Strain MM31A-1" /LENGTH=35 /DNA_ID= /DNA_START= /DNA_END= /DNA_ORIENTATION=
MISNIFHTGSLCNLINSRITNDPFTNFAEINVIWQ